MSKTLASGKDALNRISLGSVARAWTGIDPRWRKSFCIVMVLNLAVFAYGMFHHAVGDHDLIFFHRYPSEMALSTGRWFQIILRMITFNLTSPIFIQLLTIILQVAAALGMIVLWKPDADVRELTLGGLLVSLMPFVNWHHYYRPSSHFLAFPQAAMVLALLLCTGEKAGRRRILCAAALVTVSLATYPASLQTYAVGWAGLLCLRLRDADGGFRGVFKTLASLVPSALSAVLGGGVYYLTVLLLYRQGLAEPGRYENAMRDSVFDMIAAVPDALRYAFSHLVLSQAFSTRHLKHFLLAIVVLGAVCLVLKAWRGREGNASPVRAAAALAAMAFLFFCTKLVVVVAAADNTQYYDRLAQMGLSFAYLFFMLAALQVGVGPVRELCSLFLVFLVLPYMAVSDLRAQETFVLMSKHDFAVANRVVSKMESRLGVGLEDRKYTFVQLGSWKSIQDYLIRKRMDIPSVPNNTIARLEGYLVFERISTSFRPKRYYSVSMTEFSSDPSPLVAKAAKMVAGRQPFPDDDFIVVSGDFVVLYFDPDVADQVLRNAAEKGIAPAEL